jgi:hypothetical protein
MVKELVARGFKGEALKAEVMRLTGLPAPDAQLLINVVLTGKGDTDPPLGPTPDLSHILRRGGGMAARVPNEPEAPTAPSGRGRASRTPNR